MMDFGSFVTGFGFIMGLISLTSWIIQLITAQRHGVHFEEVEKLQGEAKVIFRLALPISRLRKTFRFGLSYWFVKKVKYKARIIEQKITPTFSKRWIRLYEYDNGSYKNIVTRRYFGTTIQEAEDLVRSWFVNQSPIKESTHNGLLLYFVSNRLSDKVIENIRNPKRDDLFGIAEPT